MRRALVAGAVALAALVAPAAASAHAVLEQTVPGRGAELARPPAQVTLRFDEPVEVQLGAVRVFDGTGAEVQRGATTHPGGRQDTIAVPLKAGLPNGGYTVTYRVISADAHPVSGGLIFNVGQGGRAAEQVDAALAGTDGGPVTATAFAADRAAQFAAIALALGVWLFVAGCWLPALRSTASADERWTLASTVFARRVKTLTLVAAGVGFVTALLGLAFQAATAGGTSLWSALSSSGLSDVLGTRFGHVWGAAAVLWLLLAVLTVVRLRPVPTLRPATVGAAGMAMPAGRSAAALRLGPLFALAFLPALSGHAGTEAPTWVMLPANVVHVVCISAWLGGIVAMLVALRAGTGALEPPDRSRLLAAAVGRFSAAAGVAFALILASGIAQSLVALDAWSQLLHTAYGRAVLVKLVLFTTLVGLGAVNRRRSVPPLRAAAVSGASPGGAGAGLLRVLRGELAVGVVVLGVTGALATYPPGDVQASGPFSTSTIIGPARMEMTVDPARAGADEIHLYLFRRSTGAQYDQIKELTASASLPSKSIRAVPIQMRKAGPGHYVSTQASFPIAGTWTLKITARVSAFDEFARSLELPIR
jgi:copper transport protein